MKKEITTSIEVITPAYAEALLIGNANNRKLQVARVDGLAAQMVRGLWRENGDTIKISKTGRLLDGQHRLNAIVKSRVPQKFIVVRGLEDEVFPTIDTGKIRTAADVMGIEGAKNATGISASIKRFIAWKRTGNPFDTRPAILPTHTEILNFYQSNIVCKSVEVLLARHKINFALINKSTIGLVYLMADDAGISTEFVADFFNRVADPKIGSIEDVPFLLREKLMVDKSKRRMIPEKERAALVLKAFRAWVNGSRIKTLKLYDKDLNAFKVI